MNLVEHCYKMRLRNSKKGNLLFISRWLDGISVVEQQLFVYQKELCKNSVNSTERGLNNYLYLKLFARMEVWWLKTCCRVVLTHSHRSTLVERRSSVNIEYIIDNMSIHKKKKKLVANRIFCGSIASYGGIEKFPISKGIYTARSAHFLTRTYKAKEVKTGFCRWKDEAQEM